MSGRKMKLLIVDDEKDICNSIKLLFTKKGFEVYSALSGAAAIKIAKKLRPNIALLDIYLKKGIDGIETLKLIKQTVPFCRCIMVTWDKAKEKIRESKKMGAVTYITKPLTIAQLLKVVDSVAKDIRKRG